MKQSEAIQHLRVILTAAQKGHSLAELDPNWHRGWEAEGG